jgi:flagellar assembly protein FliH
MTRAYRLDSFDDGALRSVERSAPTPHRSFAAEASQPDLEEERLASFDKGYRAGWDDAAAAHSEEQGRIAADLARNLQDLSFTYHEAHAAMQRETVEILRGMLDRVLPAAMHEALVETLLERVRGAMAERSTPVEIVLAPGNVSRVQALVADRPAPPLSFRAEPSLGEGQAFLRIGAAEEKIDYDGLMAELEVMVDRYCEDVARAAQPREAVNG